MNFKEFLKNSTKIKEIKLGGLDEQFRLAPKIRLEYNAKKIQANKPKIAAVLALFYPSDNNTVSLLLTKRASYNGTHSGQISFPGGKTEVSDYNLEETALRETFEETGVFKENTIILREFTDVYIPPSNFLVTPFIGVCHTKPSFKKNNEVEEILEISYDDILDDNNIHFTQINNSYMEKTSVPCFQINGLIIWGATAMILSEIKEALKNIKP